MRQLLADRTARTYLAGQGLSVLGDTALWLAMGVWVKTLTGSNAAAGLVFFAFAAPLALGPLAGQLVDRVRRRPLLIAVNVGGAAVVLLLLLVRGPADVWLIYGVMFLYGVAYALIGPAQSALLTALLPPAQLGPANAALQTVRQSLRLFAPLLGASLIAAFGAAPVVALDAATFLAAAVSLLMIQVTEPRPRPTGEPWRRALVAGIAHVARTPVLWQLAVSTGVAVLVVGFAETTAFAVVDTGLHRPPVFLGVLISAQGAGAVVSGVLSAPAMRRAGGGALVAIGMFVFAAGAALQMLPSLVPVLLGSVLWGVAVPWINVAFLTLIQRWTPRELQGRVYSAMDTAIAVPQSVSIAIGAGLSGLLDYRLMLLAMAAVIGLAGAYLATRPEQRASPPAELPSDARVT